ncbi:MAG: MscS family membrane protein [Gammaproteobacteria bacterium]
MTDIELLISDIDQEWVWVIRVFIIVLLTAFCGFLFKRFLGRLLLKLSRTKTRWDDIIVESMRRPSGWVIWLIGLDIAADLIRSETGSVIFNYSDSIREVGILTCISWFILALIRGAEAELTRNSEQLDQHTAEAMGKLIRLTVIITSALVILQTLGFSISGVLAMGGVGGIAIGFAAKDLLANFFGGLVVYLDRPFAIGDWIRSPDREIEGTVEKIGWRVTVIRNFASQPMYVPNSVFTNIIVENPSRMDNRRIYETIGLRYSDLTNMNAVVSEVQAMLINHDEINNQKTLMVNFNAFSDSSVDFFIYAFTKTTQWAKFHEVKQAVMLEIARIIEANHAEIAYPTSTLYMGNSLSVISQENAP